MLAYQEKIANAYNHLGFPDPQFVYGFQNPASGIYQAHLVYDCPNLDIRDFLDYADEVIGMIHCDLKVQAGGSQNGGRINLHFFIDGYIL